MAKVKIYTTAYCPYCTMAKRLLDTKQVAFEEISVDGRGDLREAMRVKAGGQTTVPQIWIGDRHIGGCDDLYALDDAAKLDPLLAAVD